ncbi:MAG: MotA/TolQ/ExbB proton channel family protein [bacterium]
MSFFSIFLQGGFIMWPILLCSAIAVKIIIERYLVIKKSKANIPAFLVKLRSFLKKRDIAGAISFCNQEKSSVSNIVKKGLKKFTLGNERVKEAIENAGRQELVRLEKGLSLLATISGAAPLLGFLGTVTGMIAAFRKIEALHGATNPSDLAGGIWEALLTTAFGLIVGIAALTLYNTLIEMVNKLVVDMEVVANDIIDILEEMSKNKNINYEDYDAEN